MKLHLSKSIFFLLVLTIALMVVLAAPVRAEAATLDGLTYVITDGQVTITDCDSALTGDIVIPDTIEGYPVTAIGNSAFYYCKSLTGVTIPNTVTSIGGSAFSYCSALVRVSVPNSVTTVGQHAFYGCSALETTEHEKGLYIGNDTNPYLIFFKTAATGVETVSVHEQTRIIHSDAFDNCTSLKSVTIPVGVTEIGYNAFYDCSKLTTVNISDLSAWCAINFGSKQANPAYKAGTVTINGSAVTSLEIPGDVVTIGDYAFFGCSKITSLTVHAGVKTVGTSAFEACSGLTAVNITDLSAWCAIDFESAYANPLTAGKMLKLNGKIVTALTVPEGVTEIKKNAFYGCTGITSVVIPEGVETIGEYAFYGCSNISAVTVPSSLSSVGNYAFQNCSAITTVNISGIGAWCETKFTNSYSNPVYYAKSLTLNGTPVTELVIPEGTEKISAYAFYNCEGLTSVSFPASITAIGYSAFQNCSAITVVNISDVAAWCQTDFGNSYYSNPTYYAKKLYLNGSLITDLTIPEGVTKISSYAFYNCSDIYKVTIPATVTSIGYGAFYYTGVDDIYISDLTAWCKIQFGSNINVSSYTLYLNGSPLKALVIPDGITTIPSYAFTQCGLTSVTIPEGVTSIGQSAFSHCSLSSLVIPEGVTSIGWYAFDGNWRMTSVTIPKTLTAMGMYAFRNCSNLKNVYISDLSAWCAIDFGTVESNPVYYAKSLTLNGQTVTSITIPEGTTEVKPYLFANCAVLTQITFPKSVTSLGKQAFYGCSSLTTVRFEGNPPTIGSSALPWVQAVAQYPYANKNWTDSAKSSVSGSMSWQPYSTATTVSSGACGDAVNWSLDEEGVLILSGKGAMTDYSYSYGRTTAPWSAYVGAIEKVVVSDGITYMGGYAFHGCSSLTEIQFLGDMPQFHSYAFSGVSLSASYQANNTSWYPGQLKNFGGTVTWKPIGMTEEYIAATNSSHYYAWRLDYDGTLHLNFAYYDDMGDYSSSYAPWHDYRRHIRKVVFSETIGNVGAYAFYDCDALTCVVLNERIDSIGKYAFYGCKSLQTIDVPDNVVSVGERAFAYCSSLSSFFLPADHYDASIGKCAFSYCSELVSVSVPSRVTIGEYAFEGCSALNAVYINDYNYGYNYFSPASNSFYGVKANVLYPRDSAPYSAPSGNYGGTLTWVEADRGSCGNQVFWKYDPDSKKLTLYGSGAVCGSYFAGTDHPWGAFVDEILSVEVEYGIEYIPSYTFEHCEAATSIVLPNSLKKLDLNAFNDCGSMNNIILPASLEAIGESHPEFIRCESLTDMYYMGTKADWENVTNSDRVYSINSSMTKHFLVEKSVAPTCTEAGIAPYYQFDKTDVYDALYDLDLKPIAQPAVAPALGHSFTNYISNGDATYTADGTKTATCDRCEETDSVADLGSKLAPTRISIITAPDNLSYGIGQNVNTTGLTFLAEYADGGNAVFGGEAIQDLRVDTATVGAKTATVAYMGQTAEFTVYIHEVGGGVLPADTYPESAHPYTAGLNELKTFTKPGASWLKLTFTADTFVEQKYDKIYLYDGNGALLDTYTGSEAAGRTVTVSGDTFQIKLVTDSSVNKYGYAFASIESDVGQILIHPEAITPATVTCTDDGLSAGTHCEICGLVLVEQVPVTALGHSCGQWTVSKEPTYTELGQQVRTCQVCGEVETEQIPVVSSPVSQWNLVLQDQIGVNFFLSVEQSDVITATVNGVLTDVVRTVSGDGTYKISLDLAAAQMNDPVLLFVNGMPLAKTYSVRTYAQEILSGEYPENTKELVRYMLHYGAAAQVYFDHDAENPADAGVTGATAVEVPETTDELLADGKIDGLAFHSTSLIYRDKIAVRYYFTGDVAGLTFTANGNTYTPVAKDGMYYIEIADILPQNLDQQITLTVTDAEGNEISVTYGPMNYIVRMSQKGSDTLKNLLKALYNYHLAAKSYTANA